MNLNWTLVTIILSLALGAYGGYRFEKNAAIEAQEQVKVLSSDVTNQNDAILILNKDSEAKIAKSQQALSKAILVANSHKQAEQALQSQIGKGLSCTAAVSQARQMFK